MSYICDINLLLSIVHCVKLLCLVQNSKSSLIPLQVLHFVNGERYKIIQVVILDDPIPEGDEKFQLILTNPSPGLELGKNVTG